MEMRSKEDGWAAPQTPNPAAWPPPPVFEKRLPLHGAKISPLRARAIARVATSKAQTEPQH